MMSRDHTVLHRSGVQALLAVVLAATAALAVDVSFSVRTQTDMALQNADFGLKVGRFEPYLGLDMFTISVDAMWENSAWDTRDVFGVPLYFHTADYSFSGNGNITFLAPALGLRADLTDRDLVPYAYLSVFKMFAIMNVSWNFDQTDYYPDGTVESQTHISAGKDGQTTRFADYDSSGGLINVDETRMNNVEEFEELERVLSPWGIGLGFGTRYDFNDHIGVFAELAFKMYFTRTTMERVYDPSNVYYSNNTDQWRTEWQHELSISVKLISSAIGVRFQF